MIHLICLRCNHANASEAKFCSECGAGLLRKFCGRCRAINDAESHFCQSCGEALPAQSYVPPAPPMVPPANVPDLTEVYADFDEVPRAAAAPSTHASVATRAGEAATALAPRLATEPPGIVRPVSMPAPRAVLLGFVGGAAVLLAVALWSRSEHTAVPPGDAPTASAPQVAAPASVTETLPGPAGQAPSSEFDSAPAASRVPSARDAGVPAERRAPEDQIAAQPPAAGPTPRSTAPPRSAPSRTAPALRNTPAPSGVAECTPQADALSLCASGAKVIDRSGSK